MKQVKPTNLAWDTLLPFDVSARAGALHARLTDALRNAIRAGLIPVGGIAEYLHRVRGADVDPDHVTVTTGILDSLSILFRALVRSNRNKVAIEDPCWRRLVGAAVGAGLEVTEIEVDAEGMQTGDLSNVAVSAAILSPSHQFLRAWP